jgi:hypothetical protein
MWISTVQKEILNGVTISWKNESCRGGWFGNGKFWDITREDFDVRAKKLNTFIVIYFWK